MKKRNKSRLNGYLLLFAGFFILPISGCQQNEKSDTNSEDYLLAAYIWPSCHHDERFGDMLWPEGTGEWEVIKKGTPRFPGHDQPKTPLWGHEMDDDPEVMEKWIDAASDHGIGIFIFDWYWFDEGPFLESSLNNGFLKAGNREDIDFYLMWANHDVKRNFWNVHKFKEDTSLLWDGAVDLKNFKRVTERVINNYFSQSNYFKINGMPVFSIFHIWNLIDGLGGIENTRKALDYFREETRKAGFPDLHLQLNVFMDPSPGMVYYIDTLQINSITKYNWGWSNQQDYVNWGNEAIESRERWDTAVSIPCFPNVSIGWDDTPRFPGKGENDIVRFNKSPENFGVFLTKAMDYLDNHPEQPKLITLFSWNEWVEGGYLLPDLKYGFQYLEEVEKVLKNRDVPGNGSTGH